MDDLDELILKGLLTEIEIPESLPRDYKLPDINGDE